MKDLFQVTYWLVSRIKENLRKKFAQVANEFQQRLHHISRELANIEGPLEVNQADSKLINVNSTILQSQQEQVKEIQTRIPTLSETLVGVSVVEEECEAANVEENDYTVFTYQDLAFELELVVQNIAKKIAFIDNQVRRALL